MCLGGGGEEEGKNPPKYILSKLIPVSECLLGLSEVFIFYVISKLL